MTDDGPGGRYDPIDPQALADQARLLGQLATSPVLASVVKEIQDAPERERLHTAERLASLDTLRARGMDIPERMRLTTRYFENADRNLIGSVLVGSDAPAAAEPEKTLFTLTICVSLGFVACVTVGG